MARVFFPPSHSDFDLFDGTEAQQQSNPITNIRSSHARPEFFFFCFPGPSVGGKVGGGYRAWPASALARQPPPSPPAIF